jgi:hypothetical protein
MGALERVSKVSGMRSRKEIYDTCGSEERRSCSYAFDQDSFDGTLSHNFAPK